MLLMTLVTPEKKLVADREVEEVVIPAARGQLTILPGHAPLITTLDAGFLRYRFKGESLWQKVVVSWGYCEVSPSGVAVLAETAESLDEINKERAEEALKQAQKRLKDPDLEPDQIQKYQRKVKRALVRISASSGELH